MDPAVATRYAQYFEAVHAACAQRAGLPGAQKDTSLCVVIHAFDNIFPFLETLQRHFSIAALVFKGSRKVHRDVVEQARNKGFPVRTDLTRDSLLKEEVVAGLANEVDSTRLINLDYGGYLCSLHDYLSRHRPRQPEYLGVVEGTENGFQRYRQLLHRDPANSVLQPIVSGARSLTKDCYDAHIGESLVDGARYALHHSGTRRLEDFNVIGILGYGKIGRSTALHLRAELPGCSLTVCEIDPVRAACAVEDGFELADIYTLLNESQLVFSITSAQALHEDSYDQLSSDRIVIACGTSPDDELVLRQRIHSGALSATGTGHFDANGTCVSQRYATRSGRVVELLGDGRTINTLMKSGSQHPTLALTEGCYIAQIFSLLSGNKHYFLDAVNAPDMQFEYLVFAAWRKHFAGGGSILDCLNLPLLNTDTLQVLRQVEQALVAGTETVSELKLSQKTRAG